ncbi:MAG: HD domain-containing protein [Lachnospiraceae bacterium]|nr:HD domain-containing protein [Lachnospiraceae bacterium]
MVRVYREEIENLLLNTGRENIEKLIEHMDENGFFTAPCSGSFHLAYEGGLAEHSLNVCEMAFRLFETFKQDGIEEKGVTEESVIIAAILHDLGKMGQFGKSNYVPNMLKGRATKANPNPEPYQSEKKPFITNPELLYVDHEIRSIQIASQFIELTEEESFAILNHNGMYSNLRYTYSGKERPLNLIIHWADMWAARVIEAENTYNDDKEGE